MIRNRIVFVVVTLICQISLSQGQWEWINGSVSGGLPVYGTQGVPSPTNNPGSGRYCATPWVDNNGMFWLWGGEDLAAGTLRNDLWRYNPTTDEWTYFGGDGANAPNGVFNIMTVQSPTTWPGGKLHGSPSWVDLNNDLWIYGTESAWTNDLWKYNILSGEWTWMHGSGGIVTAPTYGTQGTPSLANTPGGFIEENTDPWVDALGNLWFFTFEDGIMWKFDTALNQWVWINGTPNGAAVYGTIGTAAAANAPGDAINDWTWCTWEDSNGDFWMLKDYVTMMGGSFNTEIWKFNPIIEQWTCMKASPIGEVSNGVCLEDINNSPPMEMENRSAWVDDCDNLWRLDGTSFFGYGLWRYNPSTNSFMEVASYGGPNYGTVGAPSGNNNPTATTGQAWWTDSSGFWLRDGVTGSNGTSVMWRYHPDSVISNYSYVVNCPDVTFTDLSSTGCNTIKSWDWDFGDGSTSTQQNPIHTYGGSGNYSVSLIVNNCTWDADTIIQVVAVNCGFSIDLADSMLCLGECLDLIVTSNENTDSLTFVWDNGVAIDNDTVNICPLVSTTYTVTATNMLGDIAVTFATITVIPLPIVNLGNDTTLCGGSLLLDAGNSGSTYLWQDNSANQTITVTTSGQYFVEVTNGGCTSTDTINVTINGPIVDLGPDITTCNPNLIIDAGNVGSTYSWQDGSANQTFIISDTGTYYVDVTDLTGCTVTDTINVFPNMISLDLGADTVLCQGNTLVLDAGNVGASYNWQDNSVNQTYVVNQSGVYYVDVVDGICSASDTIEVLVEDPVAVFSVSDTIGCAPLTVFFSDLSSTSPAIVSWNWNFGDGNTSGLQNPSHIYSLSGVYMVSLEITTANGCVSNASKFVTVEIFTQPVADFTFSPSNPELNNEVLFQDLSIDATSWYWNFGDETTTNVQNPTHAFSTLNSFDVTLIVTNGECIDSTSATIVVGESLIFYVPNAFTPDGDEFNNTFQPVFTSGYDPHDFHLEIYNRWGEVLFESYDAQIGWDGTYKNNSIVQDGVYTWKIEFGSLNTDKRYQYTGHVVILR